MHERSERVSREPPLAVFKRHSQTDVPRIPRIGQRETSLGMSKRRVEEALPRGIATDDAIERHDIRRWELGRALDEIGVDELDRVCLPPPASLLTCYIDVRCRRIDCDRIRRAAWR